MGKKRFGVMLDMSRNAVMKVEEVKKFAKTIADLGYNMIQLYTEDTYTVENEPYFGYMRGRLTSEEIKEIDTYCASIGVEVIPCIQTLAHMNAIFRWAEYQKFNDVNDILLIDEPRTYEFIENLIISIKKNFNSKIVHIGMDEAHMVGLGRYLDKYGYKNRFDILIGHLNKVMDICKKHGLEPLIWSDMFFRLINHGDYYLEGDLQADAVDCIKDKIPTDVGIVYWDYYNTERSMYKKMIDAHYRMSNNVWFAGGAWTWRGFAPLNKYSLGTMLPAMQECRENGVDNVLITMWGDDGAECSRYSNLPSLYYIKRVYDGEENLDVIKKEFKDIIGEDFDAMMAFDLPNYIGDFETNEGAVCAGKYLLYNDPFRGFLDLTIPENCDEYYTKTAQTLKTNKQSSAYAYAFTTLEKLCEVLALKGTLGIKIRKAYEEKDNKALKNCVKIIDKTLDKLDEFYDAFRAQWYRENKPHGFDIQDIRLGGLIRRLKNCKQIILDYVKGKIQNIPELEEKLLPFPNLDSDKKGAISFNSWMRTVSVNCMYHI